MNPNPNPNPHPNQVLEDCVIESSRGEQRACAGVVLRNGARVELRRCMIRGASSAVLPSGDPNPDP